MLLYYQQTLYEMLDETNLVSMNKSESPLTEDQRLALKELLELT